MRVKIAYISERDLIDTFYYPVDLAEVNVFRHKRFVNIPEDYKIQRIGYDVARNGLCVLIYHPTFDDVPVGEIPPIVEVELREIHVNEKNEIIYDKTWREKSNLL